MIIEIILLIFVLTEAYVIWNLMRKAEVLETGVEEFTVLIESVNQELQTIDQSGAFAADDEVGATFNQIKQTISQSVWKLP